MTNRLEAARRKHAADGLRGVLDVAYRKTILEAYSYAKNREFEAHDKRVWVHIGAHRTGSTTLQRQLKGARDRLRESSVLFDEAAVDLGKRLMWGSPLEEAALRELSGFWQRRIASRRERVTLLSCEGFFGLPYVGYANGRHVARDLRRILGDCPVEVVAVVRKQDRWTESAYQLFVRRGGVATFAEFLRDNGPFPPSWDELLAPWVSQFGRDHVHVHLFETTFRDDVHVIDRLFGGFGQRLTHVTYRPARENPGLPGTWIEVLRRCNDVLSEEEANLLVAWVTSNLRSTGGYRYFSDDERAEYMRLCAESNTRLFREYFPDADRALYVPDALAEGMGRQS